MLRFPHEATSHRRVLGGEKCWAALSFSARKHLGNHSHGPDTHVALLILATLLSSFPLFSFTPWNLVPERIISRAKFGDTRRHPAICIRLYRLHGSFNPSSCDRERSRRGEGRVRSINAACRRSFSVETTRSIVSSATLLQKMTRFELESWKGGVGCR